MQGLNHQDLHPLDLSQRRYKLHDFSHAENIPGTGIWHFLLFSENQNPSVKFVLLGVYSTVTSDLVDCDKG